MEKSAVTALLLVLLGCAGGGSIESRPLAELDPVSEDIPVYLFVRDETLPPCPWEVIGSVDTDDTTWLEHQARRDAVSKAVRAMGGQAVILDARDDAHIQVIRFLDPYSICDPRD